ncbi:hypothetical protein GCM10018790_13880 [Kitasatospora xanthocidica]|uniref:hypothetical protein n=1 Tax=Kitasatospora xanthocidica TaxID=83382 RepID=UPI001982C53D|nr:hypothetical protein [Kitasatospora xanthocidica]GHF37463.1 hypothetical protein GCM10018790_13880 [Kitasatospora xanthocidica]
MSDAIWSVLAEGEREQWEATPLVGVGPLRFGMTRGQVSAALGREPAAGGGDFATYPPADRRVWGSMLTAYFRPAGADDVPPDLPGGSLLGETDDGHEYLARHGFGGVLAAVAVDARFGPQVRWEGLALTGRVPSATEDAVFAKLQDCGLGEEIRVSQEATYSYGEIGLLLRVQRAGDVLLTRPVLAAPAWTERLGDTSEGPIPSQEWRNH